MRNDDAPVVGDLVVLYTKNYGVPIFPWWGRKELGYPVAVGQMFGDELAIVLEDLHAQGGNGARVLISSGKTGWIHINFIERAS